MSLKDRKSRRERPLRRQSTIAQEHPPTIWLRRPSPRKQAQTLRKVAQKVKAAMRRTTRRSLIHRSRRHLHQRRPLLSQRLSQYRSLLRSQRPQSQLPRRALLPSVVRAHLQAPVLNPTWMRKRPRLPQPPAIDKRSKNKICLRKSHQMPKAQPRSKLKLKRKKKLVRRRLKTTKKRRKI